MNNKQNKIKKWNFAELRKLANEIKKCTEKEAKKRFKYANYIEREIWRPNSEQICPF